MIARWDVLLVAAVLGGASMMIENSHRVDTGLADDVVAAVPACFDNRASPSPSAAAVVSARSVSAAEDDDALIACD